MFHQPGILLVLTRHNVSARKSYKGNMFVIRMFSLSKLEMQYSVVSFVGQLSKCPYVGQGSLVRILKHFALSPLLFSKVTKINSVVFKGASLVNNLKYLVNFPLQL